MKATERTFQQILISPDRYVIPVFQRHYSWDKENWKRLWDDLLILFQDNDKRRFHFLGTIVCVPEQHMPGVPPSYQVIDGQQRLMTLSVLLCAIRYFAKHTGREELAAQVEENFLIHKFAKGQEHYKVYPRLQDRTVYLNLVDDQVIEDELSSESLVYKAYRYFLGSLTEKGFTESEESLLRIFELVTARLDFVVIVLNDENPYKIFQSLNSTGADLNQGDLIRNHVFMAVPIEEQDNFDDANWIPLEKHFWTKEKLDGSLFTNFFRDVLMSDGSYVLEDAVYEDFEKKYPRNKIEPIGLVTALNHKAKQYDIIRGKTHHSIPQIDKAIQALAELNVNATYHLVLSLLHKHEIGLITDTEMVQSLQVIASFVVRRHVCSESSRHHGDWFCTACRELGTNPLENLVSFLKSKGWPSDDQFAKALVGFKLYKSKQKLAILKSLEEVLQAKDERVDLSRCSIEHVLPQSIGDDEDGKAWKKALGKEWMQKHDQYLHTLGNLTLVGAEYNNTMRNKSFQAKRDVLGKKSVVSLNKHFANPHLVIWNDDAIVNRTHELTKVALNVWKLPIIKPRGLWS